MLVFIISECYCFIHCLILCYLQNALLASGHLTQEQYDALIGQQRALEEELRRKNEARKAAQLVAIEARMAQRKAKRLTDLREQHERDRNKVSDLREQHESDLRMPRVRVYPYFVDIHNAATSSLNV